MFFFRSRSFTAFCILIPLGQLAIGQETDESRGLRPSLMKAPFDEKTARAGQKEWAKFLRKDVTDKNSIGMTMVLIPPGEFQMGSPESKAHHKDVQHRVQITNPFYMGQTEVTQAQWKQVMKTAFPLDQRYPKDVANYPAMFVNWKEAVEFCEKLTEAERQAGLLPKGWRYALPTEAQWEYACRAGTTEEFSFGNEGTKLADYGWYGGFFDEGSAKNELYAHMVGQKLPNPWGLFDMHGNVSEWCEDWYDYDYYKKSPVIDPQGPDSGSGKVLRGGNWHEPARYCRSAVRAWGWAIPWDHYGFRVVRVSSS